MRKCFHDARRAAGLLSIISVLLVQPARPTASESSSQKRLSSSGPPSHALVIKDVTLIDGTGSLPRAHVTLVITTNRVTAVGPDREVPVPKGVTIVDGRGKFAIPGLWDMHVHLIFATETSLPLFVSYGITTVRDMGGDIDQLRSWRERIESANLLGPRIYFCGPMLESSKAMQDLRESGVSEISLKLHVAVNNPEEARREVTLLSRQGVDCIKIRSYENPETYFALAAAAKTEGIRLVGHAPWGIDPIQASDAGQVTLEHGFYPWPLDQMKPEEQQRIFQHFRQNKTMIDPTLITWESRAMPFDSVEAIVNDSQGKIDARRRLVPRALIERWCENLMERKQDNREGEKKWREVLDGMAADVGLMHKAGIGVLVGTDVGGVLGYPGSSVYEEMQLLVDKAHFTPMEALMSASSIPARSVGDDKQSGTVEIEKRADIVLLDEDPTANIANVRKVNGVVANGRYLSSIEIRTIWEKVQEEVAHQMKDFHMTCVGGALKAEHRH